ncbi:NAD(P)-dependent oxidoreductase [Aliibacillus thermotolerans]|uniref:NAD(P)-dependent oxidoreductase n=1 Tax=Aliibacillus thermotolerans TaxID=1834418 RepID=A0ABW0U5L5_9BACI|nr:NAD(P)-dependent oxidoreductase [Aliibacillus thermotolerans]MDA3129140.1 NAD-binding protein [Aliibacillus thermotolerans]
MAKIGYIGLGNMGMPMAHNLLKAGYDVYGLNRSKQKEERFKQMGGNVGFSLPELVKQVDVVMTCLPLPEDVEEVILGEDGVLTHIMANQLVIDFSTVSPSLHEKIEMEAEKKRVYYVDAPVSGGTTGAEAGTLSIMVGGKAEAFEKAKPYFDVVGKNITHCGSIGMGTKVKLINNYMVGLHTIAVSEGLHLAEKAGLDRKLVYDVLTNGFAQSKIFDRHYREFIAKDIDTPGFALNLLLKDLHLADDLAKEVKATLPIATPMIEMFEKANENHYGEKDMSSLYHYVNN